MKYLGCIVLFFLFSNSIFSQVKTISHTVLKGETVYQISKFYNIKPSEIYDLNPEAINGIQLNAVLLIPVKEDQKSETSYALQTHEVKTKETAYGIAKQYNITVDELYRLNPQIEKEGLKITQMINVPSGRSGNATTAVKSQKTTVSEVEATKAPTRDIIYEVSAKETLYSIAKQHEVSLADLQKANPELEQLGLQAGQRITIPVRQDSKFVSSEVKKEVVEKTPVEYNSNASEVKVVTTNSTVNQHVNSTSSEIKKEEEKAPVEYNSHTSEIKVVEADIPAKEKSDSVLSEVKVVETTVPVKDDSNSSGIKVVDRKISVKTDSNTTTSGIKVVERRPSVEKGSESSTIVGQENKELTNAANNMYNVELVDKLIATASENMGTRYRSGGTTKDGFDCSGLMYYTFGTYDVKLPRSSVDMAGYGSKIDTQNAQKGDLIFFRTNGRGQINHVGMVVEVLGGEIKFIHSSTSSGVIVSSTKEAYYEKSFAQVNRVL